MKLYTLFLFTFLSACTVKTADKKPEIDTLSIVQNILSDSKIDSMYRPLLRGTKMIVVEDAWIKKSYFSGYENQILFISPQDVRLTDTTFISKNPFIVRISPPKFAGLDSLRIFFVVAPVGSAAELLYVKDKNTWKTKNCTFVRY